MDGWQVEHIAICVMGKLQTEAGSLYIATVLLRAFYIYNITRGGKGHFPEEYPQHSSYKMLIYY